MHQLGSACPLLTEGHHAANSSCCSQEALNPLHPSAADPHSQCYYGSEPAATTSREATTCLVEQPGLLHTRGMQPVPLHAGPGLWQQTVLGWAEPALAGVLTNGGCELLLPLGQKSSSFQISVLLSTSWLCQVKQRQGHAPPSPRLKALGTQCTTRSCRDCKRLHTVQWGGETAHRLQQGKNEALLHAFPSNLPFPAGVDEGGQLRQHPLPGITFSMGPGQEQG